MNIKLNIPKSWNELPSTSLKKIAGYFHKNKTGRELDLLIFFALLNFSWWQFKNYFKTFKILKNVPISELKKHFDFIYTKADRTIFLQTIKIKNKLLFAPGNRLHNITIEEFAICEDFFFHYTQTQNVDYLRYITAILYREKLQNYKVPFVYAEIDDRFNMLKKVSTKTLLAIAICYKGSSLEIQNLYPAIFKRVPITSTTNSKPQPPGLRTYMVHISGGKFGSLSETKKTNVHEFLKELSDLIIKSKNGS